MYKCHSCCRAALPNGNRSVSLSSMNRAFKDVVCIDRFLLSDICMLNVMDSVSLFSAFAIVPDTSLGYAILSIDFCWLSQFWPPAPVQFDDAFNHYDFKNYQQTLGIEYHPVPPHLPSKNVLESKHGVIRNVFLRILHDDHNNAQLAARLSESQMTYLGRAFSHHSKWRRATVCLSSILYDQSSSSKRWLVRSYSLMSKEGSRVFCNQEVLRIHKSILVTLLKSTFVLKNRNAVNGSLHSVFSE